MAENQRALPIEENILELQLRAAIDELKEHTTETHFAAIQDFTLTTLLDQPTKTAAALAIFVNEQATNKELPATIRDFYERLKDTTGELVVENVHTEIGIIKGIKGALNLTGGEVKG